MLERMHVAVPVEVGALGSLVDQRVILHGVSWRQYEEILAVRGERSVPRLTYLEGDLELMSPSIHHEMLKTLIGRLLEAWADEIGIDINGYGSWTITSRRKKRGAEPDECYIVGEEEKPVPDFAIEVIWTSGGLDKLEVYRRLGVPEVWVWQDDALAVFALRAEKYEKAARSRFLPQVDPSVLLQFLGHKNQSRAVRELRALLRRKKR